MNIPENLKYSKDHEWVKLENNSATIGLSDFAQSELGDVIFIEFPEVGEDVEAGEPAGSVEAVKTVADIFPPVSGNITEINTLLEDSPESINSDPYGDGWIMKIEISDPSELDALLSAEEYQKQIG